MLWLPWYGMDRRAAWVLVGLTLDVAALVALASHVPWPSSTAPRNWSFDLLNPVGAGAVLALVHGVALPMLVWPNQRLSPAEVGWVAVVAIIVGPMLVLAAVTGFSAAAPVLYVLVNIDLAAPSTQWVPVSYRLCGGWRGEPMPHCWRCWVGRQRRVGPDRQPRLGRCAGRVAGGRGLAGTAGLGRGKRSGGESAGR